MSDKPDRAETQQIGLMVKLWSFGTARPGDVPTRLDIERIGAERHPRVNPDRRRSPAMRDLLALGKTALDAGYEPGDTIPPKRKRVR